MAELRPTPPDGRRPVSAHIVLVEPLIGGNAGSVARLCAGTHAVLHLVEPLGFALDDRYLRRAGLDYWPDVMWRRHPSLEQALIEVPRERIFLFSSEAPRLYSNASYPPQPWLVFGKETTGFPPEMRRAWSDRLLRLPTTGHIRSLNLANVASVALYEALRQQDFPGIEDP